MPSNTCNGAIVYLYVFVIGRFLLLAASKDLRSLATLACTVLRKCLPKTPLPLSNKENPVKFHLPSQTPLGSEDDDSEDACPRQIHVCRSAPQLSQIPKIAVSHDSLTRAREHQDTAREHQDTAREHQDTAREHQDTAREHQDTAREHQPISRKAERHKKKSSSSSSSSGVSSSSLEPLDLSAFPELQSFIKASESPLLDSALVEESGETNHTVTEEEEIPAKLDSVRSEKETNHTVTEEEEIPAKLGSVRSEKETNHTVTEEEEIPAKPSDIDNVPTDARFFEITSSPENIDLSQFDDFFPELQHAADMAAAKFGDKMCKTQSVPVLSLTNKETSTSSKRDVCQKHSPPSKTGEDSGEYPTVDKHTAMIPTNGPRFSPIVVPTATLPSSEFTTDSTSDDEGISFKIQPGGTPGVSQFDNKNPCAVGSPATDALPKTLEQPHPQLLGHAPPTVPEPYYKKTPAVER